MRQPLEDKIVTIARAHGTLTFPANFQLVAAMNPCPQGHFTAPPVCSTVIRCQGSRHREHEKYWTGGQPARAPC
jgi:predicted ATPase with chaperone activity